MNETGSSREKRSELLMLTVVLIWATNYPLTKYVLNRLDPLLFNAIRFISATLILAGIFFWRSTWVPIRSGDWKSLIIVGLVANVFYQTAFIVGLNMTTAGNAAIILATSPLWTVLLGSQMRKEQIRKEVWIGMFASMCGIAMIVIGSGKRLEFGSTAVYGDLLSLAAAVLWGLNSNLQKPLVAQYPTIQVTFVMITIGAVGLGLTGLPAAVATPWAEIPWIYFAGAILSGVLSIGVANFFWSTGVKYLGPGRTANYTNLIPVLAFIVSYFALDEQVYLMHFTGAAMTVFGVWYARR